MAENYSKDHDRWTVYFDDDTEIYTVYDAAQHWHILTCSMRSEAEALCAALNTEWARWYWKHRDQIPDRHMVHRVF